MKKIIVLLSTTILIVVLISCGGSEIVSCLEKELDQKAKINKTIYKSLEDNFIDENELKQITDLLKELKKIEDEREEKGLKLFYEGNLNEIEEESKKITKHENKNSFKIDKINNEFDKAKILFFKTDGSKNFNIKLK